MFVKVNYIDRTKVISKTESAEFKGLASNTFKQVNNHISSIRVKKQQLQAPVFQNTSGK